MNTLNSIGEPVNGDPPRIQSTHNVWSIEDCINHNEDLLDPVDDLKSGINA